MADYRNVTACRLCDSEQLVEALNLGETPLANELDGAELFPLVVNRCESCGHHQLSIAVSPERLWGPNYPYQSGTSPVFRKHLEALADEVAALKPDYVLEIASNDGTLCDMIAARGVPRVDGVDPIGPDTVRGNVTLMDDSWPGLANGVAYDVILALNIFAHVDDLHGFTAAVKEALAPDGVFIVEVGYLPLQIERGQFDTMYHAHLSYHSIDPLFGFFLRHGLVIDRAEFNESQGGTLRLYLRHKEEAIGDRVVDSLQPDFGMLGSRINMRGAALRLALHTLAECGEKVAIYGAPAKLTTFMYAMGLTGFPFDCVAEDNPRKVGRTTPGMHIPIVTVEEMLSRKPDTIIVAAWNFYDDIAAKLRRLGFNGRIIKPMGSVT